MNCDPSYLMQQAACFKCIPRGMQREVQLYLLCYWANHLTPTPPAPTLFWVPETVVANWVDGGGANSGNLAAFLANPAIATVTTLDLSTKAITDISILPGNPIPNLANLDLHGCASLNNATLTGLSALTGNLDLYNSTVSNLNLDNLTKAKRMEFSGCSNLINLNLPALTQVTDYLGLYGSGPTNVFIPVLGSITNGLFFQGSNLVGLDLPALTTVGANVFGSTSNSLVYFTAHNFLHNGSGEVGCASCNNLTTIDLTSMTKVFGLFNFYSNQFLNPVGLVALQEVTGDFSCYSNAAQDTFYCPAWLPTDGTSISFFDDILDAPSVELFLSRCVLAGVTTCTIDLTNGGGVGNAGFASLNAQGQADATALGAQLSINP